MCANIDIRRLRGVLSSVGWSGVSTTGVLHIPWVYSLVRGLLSWVVLARLVDWLPRVLPVIILWLLVLLLLLLLLLKATATVSRG